MTKYRITVPGTSANIGPGFDAFGMALGIYNIMTFERRDSGLSFENTPEEFANAENYTVKAFRAVYALAGKEMPGLHINEEQVGVPVSRGLGSSALMYVCGAVAASLFLAEEEGIAIDSEHPLGLFSREELLRVTTELEGHPDNLAPAFFGGFTMSVMEENEVLTDVRKVHPSVHPVVLIPDFPLLTSEARAVLPASYSRADAVYNLSRAAMIPDALERGDSRILRAVLSDRLHQPYRKHLITDFEEVRETMAEAGALSLVISGAGPTLLSLFDYAPDTEEIGKKLSGRTKAHWEVRLLPVDNEGVKFEKIEG